MTDQLAVQATDAEAAASEPAYSQPNPAQKRAPIAVSRWPTELPLLLLVLATAGIVWLALAVSIVGLIYAVLIGLFLFASQLVFVTYVRGSAVRIGREQFPELHERVQTLSARAGLAREPEAYVMEAGTLNAFATKFFGAQVIVLFSDLLDACGDDTAARDMVIGHEIGHLRCGHLRLRWLLIPGLMMPFIGSAYSRACEFTCDRYGKALCEDPRGAIRGLEVLAAGGALSRRINREAFIEQSRQLKGSWMTLGRWLARYPQLCERVDALEHGLSRPPSRSFRGSIGATFILLSLLLLPIAGLFLGVARLMDSVLGGYSSLGSSSLLEAPYESDEFSGDPAEAIAQVDRELDAIGDAVRAFVAAGHELPEDDYAKAWRFLHPDDDLPLDPFDGYEYGMDPVYSASDSERPTGFQLWSSGPNGDRIVKEFSLEAD